ncbi:glycerate kinase [Thalassovita sp.]|uniref:glycerate kinase type-2 family protein n=1 Tax=Thalassovita sp. TaxID=1979401 RepID=UPI0029DE62C5|nr:DUF4147 domain-containing protein [Thalassovita sp.]
MTATLLQARTHLLELFQAGVAAADPFDCVTRHIDQLPGSPSQIIAVGKAAVRMTQAALTAFPGTPALIVTNYENAQEIPGARIYAAAHPVPDAGGLLAGAAVTAALQNATGPVLALISGGGSALLPAPAGDLTLKDKAAVNAALLGAGLDIREMNVVRQQLSDLKGGGFLRHAAPHPVYAFILSDVIGDDISTIASGPTAPPLGTCQHARDVLQGAGLWDNLPTAVRDHLSRNAPPALPPGDALNILVGSNSQSLEAMKHLGRATALPCPIEGDVQDAARQICDQCLPGVTVWGGETTVRLKGSGTGGRNQELALRIAQEAKERGWKDWACLQAGSDGRDGPTDAAGGLVDSETLSRLSAAGADLDALLANNDSYAALQFAKDLVITGATGTNVADLGAMIRLS